MGWEKGWFSVVVISEVMPKEGRGKKLENLVLMSVTIVLFCASNKSFSKSQYN